MKSFIRLSAIAAAALGAFAAVSASAAGIVVSEVAPYASGNTAYAADWFELTNTGTAAVDISGWAMDDSSDAFSTAVALRGVTSIAAGQSVVFIEDTDITTSDADLDAQFKSAWFGPNAPASLAIGNYGGKGVGLSTSGDAVNIFDATGTAVTGVSFGSSTTGVTFDNAAGASGTITTLSSIGSHGAFESFDGNEIGSPGTIAAAVPEPGSYVLMLGGLAALGFVARRRQG